MQHAVITGGSSGIGKAIAHRLWQQGYSLTLMARREAPLTEAKNELIRLTQDSYQQVETIAVDVSQEAPLKVALNHATHAVGPIDLLVNSAGICTPGHFIDQTVKTMEHTMAVNFFGSLYASHTVIPMMIERQQGQIVFISSGVGLIGLYGYSSYCPSKFAIRGLAESLRAEMKPQGVQISIVYPPDTETPQLIRENAIKPLVTKKLSESAQVLSADQVANSILQGITSKRFMITPGLEMTLLGRFHSLLNPVLNRYFDGIIAKILATTQRQQNGSHP